MNPTRLFVTVLYFVVYVGTLYVCFESFTNGNRPAASQMFALAMALLVAIAREYQHKARALLLNPADVLHDRCARIAPDPAPADDREPPARHGPMNLPRALVTTVYTVVYLGTITVSIDTFLHKNGSASFQMLAVAVALLVAIGREYRHAACLLLLTPTAPASADDREQPAAHGDA